MSFFEETKFFFASIYKQFSVKKVPFSWRDQKKMILPTEPSLKILGP